MPPCGAGRGLPSQCVLRLYGSHLTHTTTGPQHAPPFWIASELPWREGRGPTVAVGQRGAGLSLLHHPPPISQGEPASRMKLPPREHRKGSPGWPLMLGVGSAGFKYRFCHLLAAWTWERGLSSLSFCFFFCRDNDNNTYFQKVLVRIK